MYKNGDRVICMDDSDLADWVSKSFSSVIKKGHQYLVSESFYSPSAGWVINLQGIETVESETSKVVGWRADRFIRITFKDGKFYNSDPLD